MHRYSSKKFTKCKNHFFFHKFFFRIISKQFSFQKNLVSEPLGIIIFKQISEDFLFKTFQKQFRKYLIIFLKKICLKNVFKNISEKCFCQKIVFHWDNPCWPIFGTNSGQKCLFKNVFQKIPKNLFSKQFQKSFQNHFKKIPKILISKKYYFKKISKKVFCSTKSIFQSRYFNKNSKKHFSVIKSQNFLPKPIFFHKNFEFF